MNAFITGPREKIVATGIILALVVAAVLLFRQLSPGADSAGAAAPGQPPTETGEEQDGSGQGARADVLELLPHSAAEVRIAADAAREFAAAYSERVAGETPLDRLERLEPLAAEIFADRLETLLLSTPTSGRPQAPVGDVDASPSVAGIRTIGTSSVIFVVDVTTSPGGGGDGREARASYAVTVVPEGGEWAVAAFREASVGNGPR
ncbi:hypothetical protein [Streptomonospora litoralis]|uniref:Mce-associated membrane protein n=1 Tax=Streptomonospora litoralis TaxID=2498135 RepID=A0A4P6Q6F1_9ACTN|nr:hypothetical protein [Streptomonospora litoralis]QBI56346.1 hypothetical protein EKD16_22965 [Streptomonospora litoralis]